MPYPILRALALAAAAAALLRLGGCAGSDQVLLPDGDDNPFRALAAGSDSTLDVATWNLHGFAGAAGGDATVDLVVDAIAALDLDVIALQEVALQSRFDQLLARLDGWAGHRAPSGGQWSLAVMWREDTVTPAAGGPYEIFPDDGRPFPRAPLVLDAVWNGRPVLVVDNHLKCCGDGEIDPDDPADEERRREEASELLHEWIAAQAPARAVVVVGDLNDRLDDPVADNVFRAFLDRPQDYRFADWPIAVGPPAAWSWGPGQSHLDHLLVTDELFAALDAPGGWCRTLRLDLALPANQYVALVSDHLPVAAGFVLGR